MTSRHNPKTKAGSAKAGPWTDAEIKAVIALYETMRADATDKENGMPNTTKAARIRVAIDPLSGVGLHRRSKGSVEAKLMNISAVLEGIRHDRDDSDGIRAAARELSLAEHGYKAFGNVQQALAVAVRLAVIARRTD